jgi:hypothetical protein
MTLEVRISDKAVNVMDNCINFSIKLNDLVYKILHEKYYLKFITKSDSYKYYEIKQRN